jgi:hypothetical protein
MTEVEKKIKIAKFWIAHNEFDKVIPTALTYLESKEIDFLINKYDLFDDSLEYKYIETTKRGRSHKTINTDFKRDYSKMESNILEKYKRPSSVRRVVQSLMANKPLEPERLYTFYELSEWSKHHIKDKPNCQICKQAKK